MAKKTLHGHVKIQLKDVHTGKVEVYERDNMVTNAISKMVNFASSHALGTSPLDVYASHWSNLLGGLVLFDGALTEEADNIYLPAGVKPVGYGIQGDTNSYTDFPEWGIYNTQESDTSQADTKVMVWDFPTSHANKRIASLCLTHRNNGLFGWGSEAWQNTGRQNYEHIALGTIITQCSKGKQAANDGNYGVVGSNLILTDGSYVDFCIDSVNDVKYMLKVCQDGLSIIKHNLYPEKFDVFRSSTYYQDCVEETYSAVFSNGYFYHCYNPDEKMLYFWVLSTGSEVFRTNSLTITINRFDMVNKTLTTGWKTATLTCNGNYITSGMVVTNTAIYYGATNNNNACIRKYTLSNGNVTDVVSSGINIIYGMYGNRAYVLNGLIYVELLKNYGGTSYNNYSGIIDTTDDMVRYTNCYGNSYVYNYSGKGIKVPPIDTTQIVFGSMLDAGTALESVMNLQQSDGNNSRIGNVTAPVHYLGTIHNFSTPIVKTAARTMKVTYTITAESE